MPKTKRAVPGAPNRPARSPDEPAPVKEAQRGATPVLGVGSRGARRKRETRERLLEAAFRLMAEHGMDAVAINDITKEADVGFGSFYNHFESKEAIYAALMDSLFEDFGDALDHLVKDLDDPAEIISVSVRHTLLRARRDPLWGRLLLREGLSTRMLSRGLGMRLRRDIERGVRSGRFSTPDPLMSLIAVGGGVLAAISAQLQLDSQEGAALNQLGLDANSIPERAAVVLLGGLGLSFQQAEAVVQRPLPAFDEGSSPS
jgi:AcrR family transcriptional regulator